MRYLTKSDLAKTRQHPIEFKPVSIGPGKPAQRLRVSGAAQVKVTVLPGWPEADHPLLRVPGLLVVNDGRYDEKSRQAIRQFGGSPKATDKSTVGRSASGRRPRFTFATPLLLSRKDTSQLSPPLWSTPYIVIGKLHVILPMLRYPAPIEIGAKLAPELDFRQAAMRFLPMTCKRLDEVCPAKWKDIDFERGVRTKYDVKDILGRIRDQHLPLSPDILAFLKSFSTPNKIGSDEMIFPNSVGGKLGNWDRFQKMLMRSTDTSDWHRHDLRRTGATIMFEMDIGASTIDHILGHINPLKSENVSASAPRYIVTQKLRVRRRNPQVEALATLGEILDTLENGLEELSNAAA